MYTSIQPHYELSDKSLNELRQRRLAAVKGAVRFHRASGVLEPDYPRTYVWSRLCLAAPAIASGIPPRRWPWWSGRRVSLRGEVSPKAYLVIEAGRELLGHSVGDASELEARNSLKTLLDRSGAQVSRGTSSGEWSRRKVRSPRREGRAATGPRLRRPGARRRR